MTIDQLIKTYKAKDGTVVAVKSAFEPVTTCVLRSDGDIARGFTYRLGDPHQQFHGEPATSADTNMPDLHLPDYATFYGLEWSLSRTTPARLAIKPELGPYPATMADVTEFVSKAEVLFCTSVTGDKPLMRFAPWATAPIHCDDFRAVQQVQFPQVVTLGPNDWFFLEIRWPTVPPSFGVHPNSPPGESQVRGTLVIQFRLMNVQCQQQYLAGTKPQPLVTPVTPVAVPSQSQTETYELLQQIVNVTSPSGNKPLIDMFAALAKEGIVAGWGTPASVLAPKESPTPLPAQPPASLLAPVTEAVPDADIDVERFENLGRK